MGSEQLGNFRILREIRRDAGVRLIEAQDESLNRTVVLHWLPEDATDADRQTFLNAVRALGAADCEHLPTVFEIADDRADPYCVLECFHSGSLGEWLTGFPPSIADTLQVGRQLLDALVTAESIGLTPLSLDADSVWLERPRDGVVNGQPGKLVVKLRDFRPIEAGSKDAARRAALWGLGAILHRMLSGTELIVSSTADTGPPPLSTLAPQAPPVLIRFVEELLTLGGEDHENLQTDRSPGGTRTLSTVATRLARVERSIRWRKSSRVAGAVLAGGALVLATGFQTFRASDVPARRETQTTRMDAAARSASPVESLPATAPSATTPSAATPSAATPSTTTPSATTPTDTNLPEKNLPVLPTVPEVVARFEPLAPGWAEFVQSLPAHQQMSAVIVEMRRRNPDFDGTARDVAVRDGRVLGFVMPTDTIIDISPVSVLTDLEWFACPGRTSRSGKLQDLRPLSGFRLTRLRAGWTQIRDLTPLSGMPLKELQIGGTQVTDLSPLAGMPIEQLAIWGNNIRDLSPLTELRDLKTLRMSHLPVRDLSPLSGLSLQTLECQQIFPRDWAPLATLPLVSLKLDYVAAEHRDLLRSIETLEEINGQPAAEVLGE